MDCNADMDVRSILSSFKSLSLGVDFLRECIKISPLTRTLDFHTQVKTMIESSSGVKRGWEAYFLFGLAYDCFVREQARRKGLDKLNWENQMNHLLEQAMQGELKSKETQTLKTYMEKMVRHRTFRPETLQKWCTGLDVDMTAALAKETSASSSASSSASATVSSASAASGMSDSSQRRRSSSKDLHPSGSTTAASSSSSSSSSSARQIKKEREMDVYRACVALDMLCRELKVSMPVMFASFETLHLLFSNTLRSVPVSSELATAASCAALVLASKCHMDKPGHGGHVSVNRVVAAYSKFISSDEALQPTMFSEATVKERIVAFEFAAANALGFEFEFEMILGAGGQMSRLGEQLNLNTSIIDRASRLVRDDAFKYTDALAQYDFKLICAAAILLVSRSIQDPPTMPDGWLATIEVDPVQVEALSDRFRRYKLHRLPLMRDALHAKRQSFHAHLALPESFSTSHRNSIADDDDMELVGLIESKGGTRPSASSSLSTAGAALPLPLPLADASSQAVEARGKGESSPLAQPPLPKRVRPSPSPIPNGSLDPEAVTGPVAGARTTTVE
jgi:hypothetical protein